MKLLEWIFIICSIIGFILLISFLINWANSTVQLPCTNNGYQYVIIRIASAANSIFDKTTYYIKCGKIVNGTEITGWIQQ
jgi:hypothetical protein